MEDVVNGAKGVIGASVNVAMPGSGAEARISGRLLAIALCAVVALRLACNLAVPSPYILTDELLYTKLARSFVEGRPLYFREAPLAFPSILYPLLISPAEWIRDPLAAFRAIQVLNALLSGVAAIGLYRLATRILPGKAALVATGLALLPPYALQSAAAMSENLFFPLVVWAVYLGVESLSRPERRWRYGLAAVLGLAYMTKPHGMTVLPLGFALSFAVSWFLDRRKHGERRIGAGGPFWRPVALYAAFVAIGLTVMLGLSGGLIPLDLSRVFGTYTEGITGRRPFDLGLFALVSLGNVCAIAAAIGFLPFVAFVPFGAGALRGGSGPDRALAILAIVLGGLLVALAARHTVMLDDPARIHERYTFYVEPLIMLGGVKQLLAQSPSRRAVGSALALTLVALLFVHRVLRTPIVADSLTYSAIRPVVEVAGLEAGTVLVWLGVAGLSAMGAIALGRGRPDRAAIVLAGYLASVSVLALVSQHFASLHAASRLPAARWVLERLRPDQPLAIFHAATVLPEQLMIEFVARNPVRVFWQGAPQHHMNDQPAGLDEGTGEFKGLGALPDGTAILAPVSVSLSQPRIGDHGDLVLYDKRGRVRRTFTVEGRYPDAWTDGHCVIVEPSFPPEIRQARIRLGVDTTSIPPALAPYAVKIGDGAGNMVRFDLPVGEYRTLEASVSRRPGQPFRILVESATWSPAARGEADTRALGLMLKEVVIERPAGR